MGWVNIDSTAYFASLCMFYCAYRLLVWTCILVRLVMLDWIRSVVILAAWFFLDSYSRSMSVCSHLWLFCRHYTPTFHPVFHICFITRWHPFWFDFSGWDTRCLSTFRPWFCAALGGNGSCQGILLSPSSFHPLSSWYASIEVQFWQVSMLFAHFLLDFSYFDFIISPVILFDVARWLMHACFRKIVVGCGGRPVCDDTRACFDLDSICSRSSW